MIIEPRSRSIAFPAGELPEDVIAGIPQQRVDMGGQEIVAIPHTVETAKLARNCGYGVPSPIETYYQWPGRFQPFDHQRKTASFLTLYMKAFVFNEIGTGKTNSALWAMDYLMDAGRVKRVLIVTPLSTIHSVWSRECFRSLPHRKAVALLGSAAKRRALLADRDNEILIINPDALHLIQDADGIGDIDLVCVDECTYFKTANTRRYKALKFISSFKGRRLWMMSGSPMPQAPTDIWAPAKLVCPDRIPRTFTAFKMATMYQYGPYTWLPKENVEQIVGNMLEPVILFRRDECIDLPETTYADIEVEPSSEQKTLWTALKNQAAAILEQGTISAANEAVMRGKFLQIATGAVYFSDTEGTKSYHTVDCHAKVEALLDIASESAHPLLVFCPFKAAIDIVQKAVKDAGFTVARIDGETSTKDRLAAFDDVQARRVKVLIASPSAMSHGITLTEANTIVWFGPIDSYDVYNQANGRIVRPGQVNKTYIIHLSVSKLEQSLYKRLQERESMQGALLDYLRGKVI